MKTLEIDTLQMAAFWAHCALGWAGRQHLFGAEALVNCGINLNRCQCLVNKLPLDARERGKQLIKAIEQCAVLLSDEAEKERHRVAA